MFSLGMGTFAFMGREALVRRTATKNYLLASPCTLQPLPNSMAHFAYFVKDLCFYVMLILSPIIIGMTLGKGLEEFTSITTPLEYSSLPWTWFAMVVTLSPRLSAVFPCVSALDAWKALYYHWPHISGMLWNHSWSW